VILLGGDVRSGVAAGHEVLTDFPQEIFRT
jgi:hypothetical protein